MIKVTIKGFIEIFICCAMWIGVFMIVASLSAFVTWDLEAFDRGGVWFINRAGAVAGLVSWVILKWMGGDKK